MRFPKGSAGLRRPQRTCGHTCPKPRRGLTSGKTEQKALYDGLAEAYRGGVDFDPVQGIVKTFDNPGGPFPAFIRAAFCLEGKEPPKGPALYKALQRTGFITADKD